MTRTPFGKTGLSVSSLGFGAAPIGFLPVERENVGRMLNFMLDHGVNLIDTAAMYQGSEELIGETVGHRRNEYVLVSKCGTKVDDIDARIWSAELITKTVDRALRRLRTDRLDVMLLHSCSMDVLKKGEALGALIDARSAGKVKFVGYSGDNQEAAWAAAHPEIAVIETSVNVADQANVETVLPVTREKNVAVLAKRPVANAAWKDLEQQPGMYKGYAATYTDRFRKMGLTPGELGFDGEAGKVWPEIALRFTLSKPGVHCAIIGTTNPENAKANIEYAKKGPLPKEAVEKIRAAFKRAESAAGGQWTGQQ